MTTSVTIHAHCGTDTEVKIMKGHLDDGRIPEVKLIQNGESHEVFVHDDVYVAVCEVKRVVPVGVGQ